MFASSVLLDTSIPKVMGVLNVTPDSFTDGGRFLDPHKALAHAMQMVEAGADIIDIGGESTRPGSQGVDETEEIDRVLPVIEAIRAESDVPISLDTSSPTLMRLGTAFGIDCLNDVRAFTRRGALDVAADVGCPICIMHMQGTPATMQQSPSYQNVVEEVKISLLQRLQACVDAGVKREHIIIDPGFGFGKDLGHNLSLLQQLSTFAELGQPVLVGLSGKLERMMRLENAARGAASIALVASAIHNGAHIIRAHDVSLTKQAVMMCHAVRSADANAMKQWMKSITTSE